MQPGSPDARRGSLASGCCCVTHTASIRYRWSAYLDLQLVRAMLGLAHRSTVQRRIPPRTGVVMGLRGEVLTRCGVRRLRRYVALHPVYKRQNPSMASYVLNSDWGDVQPNAQDENAFLASHSWSEYGEWHLGLTEGAAEETKARYAFVYGDFRRLHRTGLIACHYRAAEWRHKEIELAAHDLLQLLDKASA